MSTTKTPKKQATKKPAIQVPVTQAAIPVPALKKSSKIALIGAAIVLAVATPLVYAKVSKSADASRVRLVFPVFSNLIEFPIPETWPHKPLLDASTKGKYIIQFAPKGQTLQKWSEIVTLEVFENQGKVPPVKLFDLIGSNYKKVCKDTVQTVLRNDSIDGHKALQGTLACPSNTSGKAVGDLQYKHGEFALFYIVQGDKDLFSFQYADRPGKAYKKGTHPISDKKLTEVQKMFNKIKLCGRDPNAKADAKKRAAEADACIKRELKSKPSTSL